MSYQNNSFENAGQTCAAPPTIFSALNNRVAVTRESLADVIKRLRGVAARALGEAPESSPDKNPLRQVRSGVAGSIDEALDDIGDQLAALQEIASRLESLA